MMFSIRSFVLYAVGTSMCGGLLVLLCLPLCALLRRLRDFGRKERLDDLIEIAEDGKIDAQEREAYDDIMDELDDIIQAAMSLKFAKEVKHADQEGSG